MDPLVIIGNGGHSKVVREIAILSKVYEIVAILDDCFSEITMMENIVYGPLSIVKDFNLTVTKFFISIGDNFTRHKIFQRLGLAEHHYARLIHPSAIVSKTAAIGYGTAVMPNCIVNAEATIGNHCILNTGSIIEHDNLLQEFVHISPNATLTGSVKIGMGAHIGASATVIPGKIIGEWSVIGAGSTVIDHVPSHCLAAGVPAVIKKRYEKRRQEV
ncbi:acetyltransferase [Metabacillus sp. KIGAM252]|uniref:Acetyltransferase n=1 Tax=Metabacillus flavus TaxID=2823519 RepID=A0ABS5LFZ5_9BACI|nr:acetyltransferase [Metabacillus flavus]MBS2969654.1 acetyltransferase [Metabacillus flavus]